MPQLPNKMDLCHKIDIVENITPEEFDEKYFQPQIPVIIKGLTKNTFAGENWSLNYFKESVGSAVVDIYDNSKNNPASANTVPDLKMKLRDFLTLVENAECSNLRIFLYNMFKHNPQLQTEFPCPLLFKGILGKIAHMFFGGKGTTVRIHYDIDMSNVLHTHFGGKKRVVLISPQYTDMLYCLPLNTYSLIDPDKPDYKNYPALALVKGYDFILEPGDSLFMPSGYWHYMTYLEGGFSVSYRKIAATLTLKAIGFKNLCLLMPLDKLINKVIGESWLESKKRIAAKRAFAAIDKEFPAKAIFTEKDNIWFI